jgi:hypothetical protein
MVLRTGWNGSLRGEGAVELSGDVALSERMVCLMVRP